MLAIRCGMCSKKEKNSGVTTQCDIFRANSKQPSTSVRQAVEALRVICVEGDPTARKCGKAAILEER